MASCMVAYVFPVVVFVLCVPAYPLDGGRIFCASLLLCGVGVSTAATVTVYVSAILALLIIAQGVYLDEPQRWRDPRRRG